MDHLWLDTSWPFDYETLFKNFGVYKNNISRTNLCSIKNLIEFLETAELVFSVNGILTNTKGNDIEDYQKIKEDYHLYWYSRGVIFPKRVENIHLCYSLWYRRILEHKQAIVEANKILDKVSYKLLVIRTINREKRRKRNKNIIIQVGGPEVFTSSLNLDKFKQQMSMLDDEYLY